MARLAIATLLVMAGLAPTVAWADDEEAEVAPEYFEEPIGVFDRLAVCESGGRWAINTGNGYYGGVQQDLVFWRRYGGLAFARRPDLASRTEQITVARRGLSVQGWAAWPACSRRLGLR